MNPERWLPVQGYEGVYEVSDLGRIRSVDRVVTRGPGTTKTLRGRVLKPGTNPETGYLVVALWRAGKGCTCNVHVLVARAFVPNPKGLPEVDHGDGDRTNAAASNLSWTTRSLNNFNWHKQRQKQVPAPAGVRFNATCPRNPWTAHIGAKYIGSFPTKEQATAARADALSKLTSQIAA